MYDVSTDVRELTYYSGGAKIASTIVSQVGPYHLKPVFNKLLWGMVGTGVICSAVSSSLWLMVHWCWKDINTIKIKLGNRTLHYTDLHRLSAWYWTIVTHCIGSVLSARDGGRYDRSRTISVIDKEQA